MSSLPQPMGVGKSITQCLKIAQIVAFNIASEASYVYILSGQKLIKNAKNDFGDFLKTYNKTVLPDILSG